MSFDASRVRAICFDLDGTLSDTDDQYVNRISRRLARFRPIRHPHRLARKLVMWMEAPGNALLSMTDTVGLDGPMMALLNWTSRHRRHRGDPPAVVPGVVEMLQGLHLRFPMAVVSSRDDVSTMTFLRDRGLLPYFPVVVTARSAPRTKPYPDPVRMAARELKVDTGNCLMVGDTVVDIRSGKSAGSQTVGVLCGFGEEAELRRHGADSILSTTADLSTLLP